MILKRKASHEEAKSSPIQSQAKAVIGFIEHLRSTSSLNARQATLAVWFRRDKEQFKWFWSSVLEPRINYYVAPTSIEKFAEAHKVDRKVEQSLRFGSLLQSLQSRTLTGHEACKRAASFYFSENRFVREMAQIVFSRDPDCGVGVGLVNRVCPGLISTFSPMLAYGVDKLKAKDLPHPEQKVRMTLKLEGLRNLCRVFFDKKGLVAEHRSRNGLPNYGLEYEQAMSEVQLLGSELMRRWKCRDILLDGELMGDTSGGNWNAAMGAAKTRKEKKRAYYVVFDAIPYADFEKGYCKIPERKRWKRLYHSFHHFKQKWNVVRLVPATVGYFRDYKRLCEEAIAKGYEGLVMKPTNGVYVCERSADWIKAKMFETIDGKVLKVFEGTGKLKGKVGAFLVRDERGHTHHVGGSVNVKGSPSLGDEQRAAYWKIRNRLVGLTIEFRTQMGATIEAKARFAGFIKFRNLKDKEVK